MSKFLKKTISFVLLIVLTYISLGFLADGYTDPFYLRFTSSKQKSLIIGTSRAAQGILPAILNSKLDSNYYEAPLFNYAFTVLHSPFGEVYFNAIEKKIDKATKDGLFIITVDPWSISVRTDAKTLREEELELSKISIFEGYPNYDYLINAYDKSMFNLILNKFSKSKEMFLHKNGWLEVTLNISPEIVEKGSLEKLKNYKKQLSIYKISNYRLQFLNKTIELCNKYGKVILVRIPTDNRMREIENILYLNFNNQMKKIANRYAIKFIDYKDENYIFPDANHLYKESGKKFTEKLANDINKLFVND